MLLTRLAAREQIWLAVLLLALAAGCGDSSAPSSNSLSVTPQAAAPAFNPAAGTYTSAQTVSIADSTPGATIYYTTDGSVPTTASTVYTVAITVSATKTINAIAAASGYTKSLTATAAYSINTPQAAAPVFSPAAATYSSAQSVTISDATAGGVIYYTLDGSMPTTASTKYIAPLAVSLSLTINAIAVANNYSASAVAGGTFTIATPSTFVSVDQTATGPAVTNKILGMNMAYWYDPANAAIIPAFQSTGINTLRWPGGSASDYYHWQKNALCNLNNTDTETAADTDFSDLAKYLIKPGNLDLAITANYGTNTACNAGGDPSEAAAWVMEALNLGVNVTHWTVGNESFGYWEEDLHPLPHDPTTYANAVATGYYPLMKAANPNTLVGVVVDAGYTAADWDPIVLAAAQYDFVEYHFYPQDAGSESDSYLVGQAAQQLTADIDTIETELAEAGHPDTPIYVGEIGSVNTNPGKQTESITQALFAGQVLGEMMNAGISRATWWIGFGGCSDANSGNFSSLLYGWQDFGGYMVFSDGLPEYGCTGAPTIPVGTLLPTARAFQLFSNVAKSGENVLRTNVSGDTSDVRAYAATNNGGSVLVLFNLNETVTQIVSVTLSGQSHSSSVSIQTYDKAIYDQSKNNIWAAPTLTNIGVQKLPLTLSLTPWSMNVITIPQ